MTYRFVLTDTPPPGAFDRVRAPLRASNQRTTGPAEDVTLAILLTDTDSGEIVGGLWGRSGWGELYIDIVSVPEVLRCTGVGTELMRLAEEEAIRRDCHCVWLDTYAFQARPFYEKLGYVVFGTIDGPAPIFQHHFMTKTLRG